jgi:hypothetical protein
MTAVLSYGSTIHTRPWDNKTNLDTDREFTHQVHMH